ncbi:MAG TPA: Crp/Fnr family transcriptional regulator [Pyrinomonadaceae bacterium]|jgi:CRP/FNR family transcriptional regulator
MVTPYGLELVEDCVRCARRDETRFCQLEPATLARFDAIKFAAAYPKGALLFVEGQTPRGVYLLCAGRVKLSTTARDARVLITRIAEPGELLGLSAALAGTPHETTAETLDTCQINFIRREEFLRLLALHGDAALRVARQLSQDYTAALAQARVLGLAHSAAAKLAHFLLAACARSGQTNGHGLTLKLTLTHEEIGQLIGASRETVTRLFSEFKQAHLIDVKGASLTLYDQPGLQALADA